MSSGTQALLVCAGALSTACSAGVMRPPADFVRAEETHLLAAGRPYSFVGTNFWYGQNLAIRNPASQEQEDLGRARLGRELDRLHALGVNNLRILGGSEGPNTAPYRIIPALQTAPGVYDEDVANGLDYLLSELKTRGMHAVMCLNNFWFWSGGMAQYVSWYDHTSIPYWIDPGGRFEDYARYTARFYDHPLARQAFERHITWLLERKNSYTGLLYRDDPTIMAWELANEPRGVDRAEAMRRWINETARFIKERDPQHLVTTGSEGSTRDAKNAGLDFELDHQSPYIDYATLHIWVQNWGLYDPRGSQANFESAKNWAVSHLEDHIKRARAMKKPLVLEEFGLARDGGSFEPSAPTTRRDTYFEALFSAVARGVQRGAPILGANFWAWSGEGRPRQAGGMWKLGDSFIGDPPHEEQGWYGVYDTDATTLRIISDHARQLAGAP